MAVSSATTTVAKIALGTTEVAKVSLGTTEVWTSATFAPSGMTKSGSFQIPASFTTVTGWTADTTNYPGSTVSSNGLVAQASKTGATLAANLPYSGGYAGGGNKQARLLVNGVVVATGPANTSKTSGTMTVSTTYDIVAGDVVTVQVDTSYGLAEGNVAAGTNTWVRIT